MRTEDTQLAARKFQELYFDFIKCPDLTKHGCLLFVWIKRKYSVQIDNRRKVTQFMSTDKGSAMKKVFHSKSLLWRALFLIAQLLCGHLSISIFSLTHLQVTKLPGVQHIRHGQNVVSQVS